MPYHFFFSYASKDRKSSIGHSFSTTIINPIDHFFEILCASVACLTGDEVSDVGFRDRQGLRAGDDWSNELVEGLQGSAVLVVLLSPAYIKSRSCGRELQFFLDRISQQRRSVGEAPARIIPVYWISEPHCNGHMSNHVKQYWKGTHCRQPENMPDRYPRVGLRDFYHEENSIECNRFCNALAARIVELSNNKPYLPPLPSNPTFESIVNFFATPVGLQDEDIGHGPLSTNIVYAVATKQQLQDLDASSEGYGNTPGDWQPFKEPPRSIERLTRNALIDEGQSELGIRTLSLDHKLSSSIKSAKEQHSPILIVLDRASTRIAAISSVLNEYDGIDEAHVGLVTAGSGTDDNNLSYILPKKFKGQRPYHIWSVPPNSTAYERHVRQVVSALRGALQSASKAVVPLPCSTLPGLSQPIP